MDETQVNLGNKVVGKIDLPTIDVNKYVGQRSEIVSVTEHKGEHGYYVKFECDILETLKNSDGKEIPIRASKLCGLQQDADGNIGWGEKTNMGLLLAKYKVEHYNDMKGKEVIMQTKLSKDGKEFLTFN